MGVREFIRDAPAGQLARQLLGWKVALYEDEKEGYLLPGQKREEDEEDDYEKEDDDSEFGGDNRWWEAREKGYESDTISEDYDHETYRADSDVERLTSSEPDYQEVAFTENDPDDPHNWTLTKKLLVFGQVCLLTLCIYASSSIMTPGEGAFELYWGVNQQTAATVLSLYIAGYSLGPLILSPLSEMPQIGRNLPYMISLVIYIILTAVGSGINNFPGLAVIRVLQGFFGSPVIATGAASASDIFPFHKVPYALSCWSVFAYAGPAVGPSLSSWAIPLKTWRWGMWETLIFAVICFVILFTFLPETNGDYILAQRARRLRNKTGNENFLSKAESASRNKKMLNLTLHHMTMPFKITVQDPSVGFINLYTGLVFGVVYSFFESFPLVFNGMYGFNQGMIGIAFNSLLLGALVGLVIYLTLIYFIYEPYTLEKGVGDPEFRLLPAVFASAFGPIGMFIYGYTARSDIVWVVPCIGIVLYVASAYLLINCIFVYLPISYPQYTASIFAANGFIRGALGTAAIHFAQPLYRNLGVGDGCAILGSCAGLFAVALLALWRYGPKLRARSKFAMVY